MSRTVHDMAVMASGSGYGGYGGCYCCQGDKDDSLDPGLLAAGGLILFMLLNQLGMMPAAMMMAPAPAPGRRRKKRSDFVNAVLEAVYNPPGR